MRFSLATLAIALSLAFAPAPATAAAAEGRAPFATELVNRPLTLPHGTTELVLPLDFSLSSDRVGEPVSFAPNVHFGVTDALTLGVRSFRGLCFTGAAHGCRDVYDGFGLDALARVWRASGLEVAAGGGLDLAPFDPFMLSLDARVVARWTAGPFALALAPALTVGLSDRDTRTVRPLPISLPLATYAFGWVQDVTGNREFLAVPAAVQVQIIPPLAVVVGGALIAPLDPLDGAFWDYATFPLGAAVLVTPGTFDVGASFMFANLFGRERWPGSRVGEDRSARVWVALRL